MIRWQTEVVSRLLSHFLLISGLLPAAVIAQDPAGGFAKGVYRQQGACTTLQFGEGPALGCAPVLGVLSQTSGRPEFMFDTPEGAVVFVSSGAVHSPTEPGKVAYEVVEVKDLRAREVVEYKGRCLIETLSSVQTVTCTTFTAAGKPAWRAVFRGGGAWQYRMLN
jgi:hypothetical protein